MPEIIHENSHGVRMVRKDFRTRSQVQVVLEKGKKKTVYQTYRFARVEEPFSSPWLSWANLDCCGAWDFDASYLDTAVQEGKKLYAGRSQAFSESGGRFPTKAELEREFENLELPEGTVAGIEASPNRGFNTYICRTGCIRDYLDLDAVFAYYVQLGVTLPETVQDLVRGNCALEMRRFGTGAVPFQYASACTPAELITTGLLLGYPLESTASLLQKN